ncbi:hypothetical protein [Allocoleopsis franciscana]|uniref:Uncharacterized protein n=1 Tax=Allocoleopsis franciscana PCC 7113 TaxID=1173027 RepID=K9WRB9_9CYAN|nr:hypothetical protein [Allocoleopsis franciscana]AFZ22334.1 hypothetical protein Mic7113_6773 [Allocoleopsis franciscana PCC 7113]
MQLTEARSKIVDKERQLDQTKQQYETMLKNLRKELDEEQKDNPSLEVERMVQLLRKAKLTDSKIVPIINNLFPPPAGHANWTKLLLPKED